MTDGSGKDVHGKAAGFSGRVWEIYNLNNAGDGPTGVTEEGQRSVLFNIPFPSRKASSHRQPRRPDWETVETRR